MQLCKIGVVLRPFIKNVCLTSSIILGSLLRMAFLPLCVLGLLKN